MPFTDGNDGSLPDYIKKQPFKVRSKWVQIFNSIFPDEGEEMAWLVANKWLKRQASMGYNIARSASHKIQFKVDDTNGFIKRDRNGDEYVNLVLTDEKSDPEINYTPNLLKKWASWINAGNYIVGDFNHKEYDFIMATTGDGDEVGKKLKNKKGIAKAVKAVYEKGKLWVKALIDKRYKNKIKDAGVSLEAYIPPEDVVGKTATDGKLFGFSFMVGQEQGNPIAKVAA